MLLAPAWQRAARRRESSRSPAESGWGGGDPFRGGSGQALDSGGPCVQQPHTARPATALPRPPPPKLPSTLTEPSQLTRKPPPHFPNTVCPTAEVLPPAYKRLFLPHKTNPLPHISCHNDSVPQPHPEATCVQFKASEKSKNKIHKTVTSLGTRVRGLERIPPIACKGVQRL